MRFYETYRSKSQELSTVSDRQIANPRIVAHYARREPIVVESRMLCVTRRRKMNVKLHQMPFKIFKFMFRERTNIFPESNSTAFVFYDCLKCDKMLLWRYLLPQPFRQNSVQSVQRAFIGAFCFRYATRISARNNARGASKAKCKQSSL